MDTGISRLKYSKILSHFSYLYILMFPKKLEFKMICFMHHPYARFFIIVPFSLASIYWVQGIQNLGAVGNLNSFLVICCHQEMHSLVTKGEQIHSQQIKRSQLLWVVAMSSIYKVTKPGNFAESLVFFVYTSLIEV